MCVCACVCVCECVCACVCMLCCLLLFDIFFLFSSAADLIQQQQTCVRVCLRVLCCVFVCDFLPFHLNWVMTLYFFVLLTRPYIATLMQLTLVHSEWMRQ